MDTKKYTFELLKVKPMSGVNKRKESGFLDDVFEKTVKKYGLKNPIPKKKKGGVMSNEYEKSIEKAVERNKLIRGAKEGIRRSMVRRILSGRGVDSIRVLKGLDAEGRGLKKSTPKKTKKASPEIKAEGAKKGGLMGGQKKLDANKDGKITGEDFKILRGSRKGMRMGGYTGSETSKRQGPSKLATPPKKGKMGADRKKVRGN